MLDPGHAKKKAQAASGKIFNRTHSVHSCELRVSQARNSPRSPRHILLRLLLGKQMLRQVRQTRLASPGRLSNWP